MTKRQRKDDSPEPPAARKPAALEWMRTAQLVQGGESELPDLSPPLDERLQAALREAGMERLFPVQAAVWAALAGGTATGHDLCVHAPTGSGKTLAFALPLVASLQGRVLRRLRALAVLPTHDLAQQVARVLEPLCAACGLSLAVCSGKGALKPEAALLVDAQGQSLVDVLVTTPGRLVAHTHSTPGFTLSHLRILVVDEVDRLLRQSYQDWLPLVLAATAPAPRDAPPWGSSGAEWSGVVARRRYLGGVHGERTPTPRLVKLIISATMTRDPSKIGMLQLHSPQLVSVVAPELRCEMPASLAQWRVVVESGWKAVALLSLLQTLHAAGSRALVFTSSVDATHALLLLLNALRTDGAPIGPCVEYSSLQTPALRSAALASFAQGSATVLVASDAATRGLDVEGIEAVISYDAPVFLKTYVHRVGRTARAGRPGSAYTLLRREEVRHFKQMMKKAGGKVREHKLDADGLGELQVKHSGCFQAVKAEDEK